jgi:hypothetical protein
MSPEGAAALAWVLGVGGGLGSIAVSAWLVFVIVDGYRRRLQLRSAAELQARVLDRIGSAREFGEFLATDAGARFLDAITVERRVVQTGILRALQFGIVALVVGVALLMLGSRSLLSQGALALGIIATALGAGLLLASSVSYGAAKHMGLLTQKRATPDQTPSG